MRTGRDSRGWLVWPAEAGRSRSKRAASQPRASNLRLQDEETERQRILELGEARAISLGCTPDLRTVLSLALLNPQPTPSPPP